MKSVIVFSAPPDIYYKRQTTFKNLTIFLTFVDQNDHQQWQHKSFDTNKYNTLACSNVMFKIQSLLNIVGIFSVEGAGARKFWGKIWTNLE